MGGKKLSIIALILLLAAAGMAQDNKTVWKDAEQQLSLLYKDALNGGSGRRLFPRTLENDSLRLVASGDWTSGFWPGILWLIYKHTGNNEWKVKAEEFTGLMEHESRNRTSHDVGFKIYNSYGNGYRLTHKEEYRKKIIEGAATLASRFNSTVGCIRSWDFIQWQYPVIIDNMMNLELLFAATRLSGDSSYYKIAVVHANTTMKNHYRPDFSCYHLVDYDTLTGKVISKGTHQGYSHESVWARGQAWGLYGYTMCYRETKDSAYLKQAEGIAAFLLNHPKFPADKVPYWDFSVPDLTNEPRDASAAAIMAAALYELKDYSANTQQYKDAADKILGSLVKYYRAQPGSHHGFILLHSTGNKPAKGEIDVPIIYADYYFLEALTRKGRSHS